MEKSIKAFPAKTEGVGGQELAPKVLADGTKQFDLTAKIVKWEVEPGKIVDAMDLQRHRPRPDASGSTPATRCKVVLKNELPESTVIHFHGLDDAQRAWTACPTSPSPRSSRARPSPTSSPPRRRRRSACTTPTTTPSTQVPNGLAGAFLIGHLPVPAGVDRRPGADR